MRRVLVPLVIPFLLVAGPINRDAMLKQYCVACHSTNVKSGGFVLQGVPAENPVDRAEVWEKVVRRVRAGEMPPAGMPTPGEASLKAFTAELVRDLDAAATRSPYAGPTTVRRINRTEYANAIADLLAIELPVAAELPQDGIAAGFDNIADALSMSPLLLERYLKVARRVSELATGTRDSTPVTEVYQATGTQSAWQEGMPFGTRGGIRLRHYFSHDGDYELRAFLNKESLTPTEGVRFFRTRVKLTAGAHTVIFTFPDEFAAREGPVSDVAGPGGRALGGPLDLLGAAVRPTIDFRVDGRRVKLFEIAGMTPGEAAFDGQPGPPTLTRVEVAGPYGVTGVSETPSRRRIFLCKPKAPGEETPCATRILTPIVRRAFRRDISDSDLQPFLKTYKATRGKLGFEEAIAAAIRDILLAPDFLFRLEFDAPHARPGSLQPVSPFELASRLSFFLWSSIPDDDLLDSASTGKLSDRTVLAAKVRQMLADRRAVALADNFAAQWLGLHALGDVEPDRQLYPEFDAALAAAFNQETRMFVRSLIRENRSILELLNANYTYLDERLAAHYGIPGVTGPGFRRVSLQTHEQRGGLLTHGSILLMTSHAVRTSPVLRGKWILDNLLNSPPAPPPADVPPLDENPVSGRKLSTREKVERHRNNPACAGCHARIDGMGFALENFDVIGRWRTRDDGGEINASGQLANGVSFSGPGGLRSVLLQNSEPFVRGTVEKLMTYALGRELDARDQPTVREIMRATEANRYRFWDLIIAIVKSVPFEMRHTQER
jgi:cytochrome c551/c552